MEETFLKDCFKETFTRSNSLLIWERRNSIDDIIALDTDFPVRYKLNESGSRNIEIIIDTKYGTAYKTMAIVENDSITLPKEFLHISKSVQEKHFDFSYLSRGIDILIGAFSIKTLFSALNQVDQDFSANAIEFEMIQAFDGTMQAFAKENSIEYFKNDFEGIALSAFTFANSELGIFPTEATFQYVDKMKEKRLLEVFTLI